MESAQVVASEAAAAQAMAGDANANLVVALGQGFHQAGVPTDQLEAIMLAAAAALGLELQVTALPTSITAAIGHGVAQNVVLLRLEPGEIDLTPGAPEHRAWPRTGPRDRAARRLRRNRTDRELAPRRAAAPHDLRLRGDGRRLSVILGGHNPENTAASIIGVITGGCAVAARRAPIVARLFEVLAAFIATVVVTLYARFVHPLDVYVPLVAGVVQQLPGLQLTAAVGRPLQPRRRHRAGGFGST